MEKIHRMMIEALQNVRKKKPLIHNITNYVTVNACANIELAIGASPIMADEIEEVCDIASVASALVINIGTLNSRTVESMIKAGKRANDRGIPVVLDPVGAGASGYRNKTAMKIMKEVSVSILRGNLSEIAFVCGMSVNTKGVDAAMSDIENKDAVEIAIKTSNKYNCVTALTGATDIVSDGSSTYAIKNGHEMLSRVTGTGCMATALVGAFSGVNTNYLVASTAAIACMGIAGEISYELNGAKGVGSFNTGLFDAVSSLNAETFMERVNINEIN